MLTIFMLFAIRTEASVLRMLEGSPQTYLHDPIIQYLEERGVKINLRTPVRELVHEKDANGNPTRVTGVRIKRSAIADVSERLAQDDEVEDEDSTTEVRSFDAVIAATDLPGIKKVLPDNFRQLPFFDKIYNLDTVPIATVQVRFDGWVTELLSLIHI